QQPVTPHLRSGDTILQTDSLRRIRQSSMQTRQIHLYKRHPTRSEIHIRKHLRTEYQTIPFPLHSAEQPDGIQR
ncbi:Hypothetical predicted protein, partial [Pelobates cultripes]